MPTGSTTVKQTSHWKCGQANKQKLFLLILKQQTQNALQQLPLVSDLLLFGMKIEADTNGLLTARTTQLWTHQ